MKGSRYIIILLVGLLLVSCEKEVKLELPEFTQKIVVDGRIETGLPPIVVLTRSQDLYAPTDINALQNNFVKNAVITVDNGTTSVVLDEICTSDLPPELIPVVAELLGVSEEALSMINFCAYSTFDNTIFGEEGKTYDLKIEVENQVFTSKTTIVQPPVIDSVYFKLNGTHEQHGYGWLLINDNPALYNTYYLQMNRIHNSYPGGEPDGRFLSAFSPVFDDEFFNGLKFDFGFANIGSYKDDSVPQQYRGYFKTGDTVVIKVSALDLEAFNFMKVKYIQDSNGGNPFAAPANAPSNISGGALGVWAGYSPIFDTLACYPQ